MDTPIWRAGFVPASSVAQYFFDFGTVPYRTVRYSTVVPFHVRRAQSPKYFFDLVIFRIHLMRNYLLVYGTVPYGTILYGTVQ